MANEEHMAILRQGLQVWNQWREEHPEIVPDLTKTNLYEEDLYGMDLSGTNLYTATLSGANFRRVNLQRANLRQSQLNRAYFYGADLSGADLSGSQIGYTTFADTDLTEVVGLETINHSGPSTIGIDTLYRTLDKIPESFLRSCGLPQAWIEYLPSLMGATQPIQFYSCFISYSHNDEEFARRLHSRMRDHNLRVWFADEDMKAGQKLHEQIDQAIRVHDKLVLVLSEHSIQSEWVMTEIRKARKAELRDNKRKLFPIRLVDMDTLRDWECLDADIGKDLAVEVREYFIPDFTRWKDHDSFERAFARLLKDLQATEAPPIPRQPTTASDAGRKQEAIQHLQNQIDTKTRRLRILEEQQARKGHDTPADIVMEIQDLRQETAELEKKLRLLG